MNSIETTNIPTANVLLISHSWFSQSPGGLDRYVYELTKHLASVHTTLEVCGVGLPQTLPDTFLRFTSLANLQSPLIQRLWSTFIYFLNRENIRVDAINIHFALYSLPFLLFLPDGVPITFTFHGPWAQESEEEGDNQLIVLFKYLVEKLVYSRCDRFIVLSRAFGSILHLKYGIPWHRIYVVPGGVDTNRFQPNLSREQACKLLSWPQDRPILFSIRRLVHRMGLNTLLDALAEVRVRFPNILLMIAGKGPQRYELEQYVKELGLLNNVVFLGFLSDEVLPIAYQAAHLTTVPSQALEGFGLVLLESLACGTPVLCTPVGGMPEVLADFYPALITDSADAQAIASRLIEFLSGKLPIPSRSACREYALSRFDWCEIAQRVRNVLLD
jgi:glycosyltransferase involved in cell wall biosynthesis